MACACQLISTSHLVRPHRPLLHNSPWPLCLVQLLDCDFLFHTSKRYLDSTKMEAASFSIFERSSLKFQVADPDAYYVHHMSMYEHLLHRKHGYEVAQNKTSILSYAALKGECEGLNISSSLEYLALIPFYGGRPPNVTSDLKVKSIGQGNSLVRLIATSQLILTATYFVAATTTATVAATAVDVVVLQLLPLLIRH